MAAMLRMVKVSLGALRCHAVQLASLSLSLSLSHTHTLSLSRSLSLSLSSSPSLSLSRTFSLAHSHTQAQLLRRNLEREGLVCKAHRFVYHSALGSRVIKKKSTRTLALTLDESGPLRLVHLPRHEWPGGLGNQDARSRRGGAGKRDGSSRQPFQPLTLSSDTMY